MRIKFIILCASIFLLLGIGGYYVIYSFRHPEKTRTQLYIDLFTGRMFKNAQ